ncbi:MAG: hypothetical protein RQ748_00865 [Elusimicrobiales bacterium]|nr:hypothetical protein [Elusimicrobiales bacterium]
MIRLAAALLLCAAAAAAEEGRKVTPEVQFDPYYTSAGLSISLTGRPIPELGKTSEREIYTRLVTRFYEPRVMVVEASFNPMPYAGTFVRRNWPGFYRDAELSETFNLVKAVTAGFEEPWALSLFFGNVLNFESAKGNFSKRTGYSGILFDFGDYHIKDNVLVRDKWVQAEGKLKGDQFLDDRTLKWSFRGGFKLHDHPGVADSLFLGFRRSRTDFSDADNFWLHNSGFDLRVDFDSRTLKPISHWVLLEKKFPLKNKKALCLGAGFVWTSGKRYTGRLADVSGDSAGLSFVLRPNLEF